MHISRTLVALLIAPVCAFFAPVERAAAQSCGWRPDGTFHGYAYTASWTVPGRCSLTWTLPGGGASYPIACFKSPPDNGPYCAWEETRCCGDDAVIRAAHETPLSGSCNFSYVDSSWLCPPAYELKVRTGAPEIPGDSMVQGRRVLTRSRLDLDLRYRGTPAYGILLTLQSSRGLLDAITGPLVPTDVTGAADAQVETMEQPGTSTITAAAAGALGVKTVEPGIINWLPARYEYGFLITCYVLSLESDYLRTELIGPVPGLPSDAKYHRGFLDDVMMQGSGQALDGTFLHYEGGGVYRRRDCALTATGGCAQDGTTVAVDPRYVPLRSSLRIESIGGRSATDTGGGILGYHIDEFFGVRRAACLKAGSRPGRAVDLESY